MLLRIHGFHGEWEWFGLADFGPLRGDACTRWTRGERITLLRLSDFPALLSDESEPYFRSPRISARSGNTDSVQFRRAGRSRRARRIRGCRIRSALDCANTGGRRCTNCDHWQGPSFYVDYSSFFQESGSLWQRLADPKPARSAAYLLAHSAAES